MYIRKCIMTNEQFLKWRASNDSEPDDRVYLDRWFDEKTPEDINFFTETDVKNWMKQHDHGGDAEYPERVKQYAKRIMWAFDLNCVDMYFHITPDFAKSILNALNIEYTDNVDAIKKYTNVASTSLQAVLCRMNGELYSKMSPKAWQSFSEENDITYLNIEQLKITDGKAVIILCM